MSEKKLSKEYINIFLFLALIIVALISLFFIGRYKVNILKINSLTEEEFENIKNIIINIRLPRVLAAILIGAGLSVSGASYQAIFKNKLVSPDLLGASSGSAFGVALAIILHLNYSLSVFISFIFGLIAVSIVYTISKFFRQDKRFTMILSGIMISTLFSSMLSFIKLIADTDNELPDITYWLMGRLSSIDYQSLKFASIPIIIGLVIIFVLRWRLNIFTVSEDEMISLGLNVKNTKLILIAASTLITAISVSICGIIGFIGLVIPHFSRLIVGYNFKQLIPTTMICGSLFLLIVDDIARTLTSYEIPIGILTSVIGVPVFIFLMSRSVYD